MNRLRFLVETKMFVEVVLVLLLYLSYAIADRFILQSSHVEIKCLQSQTSDSDSYYF